VNFHEYNCENYCARKNRDVNGSRAEFLDRILIRMVIFYIGLLYFFFVKVTRIITDVDIENRIVAVVITVNISQRFCKSLV
jgi:hypothetical protein